MAEFRATHLKSGWVEKTSVPQSDPRRIFLLSPASIAGIRGESVMHDNARSGMARRLRQNGVTLGDLFSFISSLYFRGKLAYARRFAHVPPGLAGVLVITASGGLVEPDSLITLDRLREISAGSLDPEDARYRVPLDRDAQALSDLAGISCEIVLLGSIATRKYVDPLLHIFGQRLVFPAEFVGRGDMSRGGLMLRCVQSGNQLAYIPLLEAVRHGRRPPKLEPLARKLRP